MILVRPWALLLLAIPVLLLWLRLRASRPRLAEASSLLVWRKVAGSEAPPSRPRPPASAWWEALGTALVVLGLAGPLAPAGGVPGPVTVLLDATPSMDARDPGGKTRRDAAREIVSKYDTKILETTDPSRDLSALLAAGNPVVVVTDGRFPAFPDDPPRLRVVGVGGEAFNAGITAAGGTPSGEGRWRLFLRVEAFGGGGPAEGTLTVAGRERPILVAPGGPLEIDEEVAAGGPFEAAVRFAGDALAADDGVRLEPKGAGPVVLRDREGDASPLLRALEAAGAVRLPTPGPPGGIRVECGTGRALLLRLPEPAVANGDPVRAAEVATADHDLTREVHLDPAVTLGRRAPAPGEGTVLLSDGEGPLLVVREERDEGDGRRRERERERDGERDGSDPAILVVEFGFLPGGAWAERDPSFVVFAKNLVEYAAGGPARLDAEGVLDPAESDCAGESFGDLEAALKEASAPDPAKRLPLAGWLFLTGAVLLAAAWWQER